MIQCCFCGKSGAENILRLDIVKVDDYDLGLQLLFSHTGCFKKVIDKNIPFLFDEDCKE